MTNDGGRDDSHKLVIGREYSFCPWCGAKLNDVFIDGKNRKRCASCDFVHYRNPIPAAGAIVETDGKILLVKRRYPPYVGAWCLPAGFMEYGETPENCCVREIEEETGLKVIPKRCFKVYAGDDDPRTRAVLVIYLVEISGGKLKPGDDASEAVFFEQTEIPANIAFKSHREALNDYFVYKKTGNWPPPTR